MTPQKPNTNTNTNTDEGRRSKVEGQQTDCFLHISITPEENSIFNWCRFRHRPAKMNAWVRETLLREAARMIAEANASGKEAPQGVNEALAKLREGR